MKMKMMFLLATVLIYESSFMKKVIRNAFIESPI